uniref:Translation initiation factor 1 n=1 Tax=Paederia scandens TaxID=284589 RepID=A0A346Q448_9GENT|nr:translation initiation factor 1 [Paederia scandens]AXR87716.1 translation initiation factor 1 [Paederia scandens]AXR87799.1 translation initiation factor 1 [Paederia scandens]AXR87883.1 translation initiation factor 1 [Paederia scandens]
MKEQKWIHEGLITESLLNGMLRVHLENSKVMFRRGFGTVLSGQGIESKSK